MAERDFIISTETTCDMPMSYYTDHGVNLLGLTYTIDGVVFDYGSTTARALAAGTGCGLIRDC